MSKLFCSAFVIISIAIWVSPLAAQVNPHLVLNDPDYDHEKRLRFGFSIGTNFMDFQIASNPSQGDSLFYANNSRVYPGFNVNAVSLFTIVPGLQARFTPGLAFGQRDVDFFLEDIKSPDYDGAAKHDGTVRMESSFVELPLHLKYNAQRSINARPYLLVGTNYRIDLARRSNRSSDSPGSSSDDDTFFTLARSDIYFEFGAGYEFFLEYFKFSVELKFSSGFSNVLYAHDETVASKVYYDAIDKLRSQIFTISFNFE